MLNKESIHALELRWEELLQSLLHLWCNLAYIAQLQADITQFPHVLNWEQFVSSVYTNDGCVLFTECDKFYTASHRA